MPYTKLYWECFRWFKCLMWKGHSMENDLIFSICFAMKQAYRMSHGILVLAQLIDRLWVALLISQGQTEWPNCVYVIYESLTEHGCLLMPPLLVLSFCYKKALLALSFCSCWAVYNISLTGIILNPLSLRTKGLPQSI